MTPYERAAQRFENISRNYADITRAARAVTGWADGEYTAAQDGLRQYELAPGLPKPEYRGQVIYDDPAWPDGCPIPFDVAKAALQARLTDA